MCVQRTARKESFSPLSNYEVAHPHIKISLTRSSKGFPKFVTSGSGLGFGFSKIQSWVWVRVQGLKFFQKTGFWVQVWVGFCKKHRNSSKISLEKLFYLYIENIKTVFCRK
jgi:hypothetical protein